MKSVVFFNNKGGVGKTTFTYHLAYALESHGRRVVLVDVDPQCNLTAHLLNDEIIEQVWTRDNQSLYRAVQPIITGAGDVQHVEPFHIPNRNIWVFVGDLLLSDFESELTSAWIQILAAQERGYRVTSAIHRITTAFARQCQADYIFYDIGPNLGALNRAILLGCDNFIIPMIPDMFSIRGSQNLGRVLANWIAEYQQARQRVNAFDFECLSGSPMFSGFVLQQFNQYGGRRTRAYQNWANEIPEAIRVNVIEPLLRRDLRQHHLVQPLDNYLIAELMNYNSLVPMAQAALKPIFELTPADGVVGGHNEYVQRCREEFDRISEHFIEIIR